MARVFLHEVNSATHCAHVLNASSDHALYTLSRSSSSCPSPWQMATPALVTFRFTECSRMALLRSDVAVPGLRTRYVDAAASWQRQERTCREGVQVGELVEMQAGAGAGQFARVGKVTEILADGLLVRARRAMCFARRAKCAVCAEGRSMMERQRSTGPAERHLLYASACEVTRRN